MMRMMDSKIMKASDFSSVFLILNNKMFKMAEKYILLAKMHSWATNVPFLVRIFCLGPHPSVHKYVEK